MRVIPLVSPNGIIYQAQIKTPALCVGVFGVNYMDAIKRCLDRFNQLSFYE